MHLDIRLGVTVLSGSTPRGCQEIYRARSIAEHIGASTKRYDELLAMGALYPFPDASVQVVAEQRIGSREQLARSRASLC